MKHVLIVLMLLVVAHGAHAQDPAKTLASTIEVYVFPTTGQDAGQQSEDEAGCYDWAVGNTGSDPFQLDKQQQTNEQQAQAEQQAAEQVGKGAAASGAVRGAAAGALIGEIGGNDVSNAAGWGAAAGAIRGRRKQREAQHEAEAQASEQATVRQEATAEDMSNFKKAFSVCLEAKDYMVKY